ncbi:hypothetical protein SK3146_05237 [Paenibacillus konkukensis]|uniref:Uncharacterized protein n=1 Tax=Paenibacillus konkukensis TaxID=2020716 RepID=A0ABY4RW83_9BACL|nr:hypothetical protein SK3146_05237 [Paenibacillus konkukensis]
MIAFVHLVLHLLPYAYTCALIDEIIYKAIRDLRKH